MGEVETHIDLVLGILEVVNPAGRVGVHIYYICVDKVPQAAERTRDGLAVDGAVVIHVCRVLRNHDHLVGVVLEVGVEVALFQRRSTEATVAAALQAILALGRHRIVKHLVAIVQLAHIEHLLARHRVSHIDTLHGALLVFVGIARQGLVPVQVGRDRFAIPVLLNLIGLVAAIGRVGQTLADDGVAHPIDKLPVHGVRHLLLVHPERIHTDVPCRHILSPETVGLLSSHLQAAPPHQHHAVWGRLRHRCATNASDFTPRRIRPLLAGEARCYGQGRGHCTYSKQ